MASTFPEMERLLALLRIPSISADPSHAPDMRRAAAAFAEEVRHAGGSAEVRATSGQPLVLGEVPASDGGAGAPRVLVYGHYDVQPPGPSELWESPAFEPTVRGPFLYARGASDDKGNLFMLLAAVGRLAREGRLPVRVGVLIDGEEECGGHSAVDRIAADREDASACIIYDGPMAAPGRPAFSISVRGLVYLRLTVRTGAADAHSGVLGGAALNAGHALMAVLAAVLPRDGRLPEPLTRGVVPVTPAEEAAWTSLPDGAAVLAEAGMAPADPRAAADFYPRTVAAPALDVHGVDCGQPDLIRTIVPATARATLSLRLAPGQDQAAMADALEALLRDAVPAGAVLEVERLGVADPALMDPEHSVMRRAAAAMAGAVGVAPVPLRQGGTLPVVAALAARGIPTILTGFSLPDDGFHGPNERLRIEHLETGTRAAMAMLEALGGAPPSTAP